MKISARNQLKGTVVEVVKGATTSHVKIDIGSGAITRPRVTIQTAAHVPCTRFGRAGNRFAGLDQH